MEFRKKLDPNVKWKAVVTFEVENEKGLPVYKETCEWPNHSPLKIKLIENLLSEAKNKFVEKASSV